VLGLPATASVLPDTNERAPALTPARRRVLDLPTPFSMKITAIENIYIQTLKIEVLPIKY